MAVSGIDVVHEYRIVGAEYVDNGYVVLHDGSSTRRVPLNDLAGFKGILSVAGIESLTGMAQWDIYASSDSGTLVNGDGTALLISAGDLVRWDGTHWELFIRLTDYVSVGKFREAVDTLTGAINSAFANVLSNLESHKEDYDNPHHVTCIGIGAAALLSFAPTFRDSINYKQGERVTFTDGKVYVFKTPHAAGAWTGTDVLEDSFAISCGSVNSCGAKTDSDVVDGVLVLDQNNSIYSLTTSLSTLIVEIKIDAQKRTTPNFVLQVTNSAALTMYVRMCITNTGGPDVVGYLNVAEAVGNELAACSAGEGNQVTCVGGCWTWAKFVPCTPPSPPST